MLNPTLFKFSINDLPIFAHLIFNSSKSQFPYFKVVKIGSFLFRMHQGIVWIKNSEGKYYIVGEEIDGKLLGNQESYLDELLASGDGN